MVVAKKNEVKIAILNKYQGKAERGAEIFVAGLARNLSQNHEVDVISKIDYLELFKQKYDLIVPTNGRLQVIIVRLISWLTGAKMVVTGHSGPGIDDRINLWAFPDVFVALTGFQKKWARRANSFVRIEKIPNGVDLQKFSPRVKAMEVGLPKPIVLISAALEPSKRSDLGIKAVAKLKNTSLLIVGRGREEEKLNELGERLLGDRFKIMSVPYHLMPRLYRAADLFTYPTVPWESFGMVLLEAMASGLGVVATDDPIRREIVGDAGIFIDPINTDAYAEALKKALKNNWGGKPQRQVEKFDWDKIALRYENLFKKLMK